MLLLIDTSGDTATVILSSDGLALSFSENKVARDHSAWLHPAIQRLLKEASVSAGDIKAVAVMAGPGSYTGLRVGMAAAKGICFALRIPLITCNNLLLMAGSMIPLSMNPRQFICPMIDARRLEVFTALYSHELVMVMPPRAMILDKTSFESELISETILFSGSGAGKWEKICSSPSAVFCTQPDVKETFIKIATLRFEQGAWADTVYSEPEYVKDFHTHVIN